LAFKDNDHILFHNSTCFILHNINNNTQIILGGNKLNEDDPNIVENYKCHDNDIVCSSFISVGGINLIASGQRGLLPLILVWDADTKKLVNKMLLPKGAK